MPVLRIDKDQFSKGIAPSDTIGNALIRAARADVIPGLLTPTPSASDLTVGASFVSGTDVARFFCAGADEKVWMASDEGDSSGTVRLIKDIRGTWTVTVTEATTNAVGLAAIDDNVLIFYGNGKIEGVSDVDGTPSNQVDWQTGTAAGPAFYHKARNSIYYVGGSAGGRYQLSRLVSAGAGSMPTQTEDVLTFTADTKILAIGDFNNDLVLITRRSFEGYGVCFGDTFPGGRNYVLGLPAPIETKDAKKPKKNSAPRRKMYP